MQLYKMTILFSLLCILPLPVFIPLSNKNFSLSSFYNQQLYQNLIPFISACLSRPNNFQTTQLLITNFKIVSSPAFITYFASLFFRISPHVPTGFFQRAVAVIPPGFSGFFVRTTCLIPDRPDPCFVQQWLGRCFFMTRYSI